MRQTYKYTYKLGTLGDFTAEWWTEEDWKKWKEYVEELKRTGEYGKEVETEIEFEYNPIFDEPQIKFPGKKSTPEFIIFDVSPE